MAAAVREPLAHFQAAFREATVAGRRMEGELRGLEDLSHECEDISELSEDRIVAIIELAQQRFDRIANLQGGCSDPIALARDDLLRQRNVAIRERAPAIEEVLDNRLRLVDRMEEYLTGLRLEGQGLLNQIHARVLAV